MNKKNTETDFWSKVKKTKSCWNWTGFIDRGGYGRFCMYVGRREFVASRISWALHKGPITDGSCVLHKCDNRRCVNPEHLYLGTYADNAHDRKVRKRHWKDRDPEGFKRHIKKHRYVDGTPGEKNSQAKLTWELVAEIRARHTEVRRKLASEYGVCAQTICDILNNKKWIRKDG